MYKSFNQRRDILLKRIVFVIWLLLLILWNYSVPNALPYEDVLVGVGLYFFNRSVLRILS